MHVLRRLNNRSQRKRAKRNVVLLQPHMADVPHLFTGRLDDDADADPLDTAPYDDM